MRGYCFLGCGLNVVWCSGDAPGQYQRHHHLWPPRLHCHVLGTITRECLSYFNSCWCCMSCLLFCTNCSWCICSCNYCCCYCNFLRHYFIHPPWTATITNLECSYNYINKTQKCPTRIMVLLENYVWPADEQTSYRLKWGIIGRKMHVQQYVVDAQHPY